MANTDNLKPIEKGDLSKEEAKRRGSKGGRNSVKSRRRKKLLRELMVEFGALNLPEGELRNSIEQMGLADVEVTNDMALVIGQFQAAIKGNPAAASFIRDTRGEKPVEKSESTIIAPKPLVDLTGRKKNSEK